MRVLVTGAGRGLGLSLVKALAVKQHTVFSGVRSMERLGSIAPLMEQYPGKIIPVVVNVSNEKMIQTAAAYMLETYYGLDAIINNAGILLGREKSVEELDFEEMTKTFQVNTFGPMMVVKYFLPLLKRSSSPTILNISSEAAQDMGSKDFAYSMSKAALNMFSIKAHCALKHKGFRIFAIHPGWIKTDMGGPNATGSADESARCIIDILEGVTEPQHIFVDIWGNPL